MRLKNAIIGTGLQILAIALANWQMLGGVRTDEAKYLLNIPYPHPPLMRWIFSLTESLPFQELFWRFLLATIVVQAVWLVWDMTRTFHLEDRILVCAAWLLSAAVLTQAGTITMAPIMAVETLVFLWLRTRPDITDRRSALIAGMWMITLFTSYPGILLLPLAWDVLRRSGCSRKEMVVYILGPVALLVLYTLTNPLALAIMLVHRNEGVGTGISTQIAGFTRLWLIGGSGIASVVGTWGIITSINKRDWPLVLSALLVSAFVFFSITPTYYAILFTPFFVAGLWTVFHQKRHPHAFPLLGCLIFSVAIITWFVQPARFPGPAREVIQAIQSEHPFPGADFAGAATGSILISGTFGHEWQYESRTEIRRYRPEFVKDAVAIVCLNACEPMFDTSEWKRLHDVPVETWVRR